MRSRLDAARWIAEECLRLGVPVLSWRLRPAELRLTIPHGYHLTLPLRAGASDEDMWLHRRAGAMALLYHWVRMREEDPDRWLSPLERALGKSLIRADDGRLTPDEVEFLRMSRTTTSRQTAVKPERWVPLRREPED